MPVYIKIPPLDIVYRDVWVMQPLYRVTRFWLVENDYVDVKGDNSMESAMEILYHFRRGTSMSPNEKELRIWWRTVQSPIAGGRAGSKFFKHHIDIDWNVIQMYDVEIMREGKKEAVQKGAKKIRQDQSIVAEFRWFKVIYREFRFNNIRKIYPITVLD